MTEPQTEPQRIGSPQRVFGIVRKMIQGLGAEKVLDCPAGQGPLARLLLEDGLDVTCCDICPEIFKLNEISCDFGDLNDRLSYEDGQFEAVTCLNGLQRVWARGRAVAELARVVKPGGHLIISIPNHGDIRRRLLYMITGSQSWTIVGPPQAFSPDAETPAAVFRYGLTLANVLSALNSVGMEVQQVRATHYGKANLLLAPLAVAVKLCTYLSPKKWTDFFYLRDASTFDAFMGTFLVVLARKPEQ